MLMRRRREDVWERGEDGGQPVLTFGSREEKVIGAVDTQHSLAVALRHVHTLQS